MEYMIKQQKLNLPKRYEKLVLDDTRIEILKSNVGDSIHYRFRGYASTFNTAIERPEGINTIKPNAFTKTLKENPNIPLLFDHDTSKIIGKVVKATPDAYGLKIEAEIVPTSLGVDVFELIKRKALTGLSIGFEVIKSEMKRQGNDYVREISEIKLFEISAVSTPADNLARIQGVGVQVAEPKTRIAASKPTAEVLRQLGQIQLSALRAKGIKI